MIDGMSGESLPSDLIDGLRVRSARPVSGGDIARAYRLETPDGTLFLKWRPQAAPGLFEREALGLRALRAHASGLGVPQVLRSSPSGLVLEWIEAGPGSAGADEDFGRALAGLHRTAGPAFGALDGGRTGYLGSQPVDLTPTGDWPEFYRDRRLRPLMRRAVELGRLPESAMGLLESLDARELCGPAEPPALVHGDLWAGNRMVDVRGRNWLIDPASFWAHREVDLAMMALFGGFGAGAFAAYDETFPLADGWRDRVDWYQLAPLLVHAVLFGGGYGRRALAVVQSYAR